MSNAPHILLLLSIQKLDTKLQQSDWFRALEQKGCIVLARTLFANETLPWLKQRLLSRELQATPEALQVLAARTEGNLLASALAIEKLRCLTPLSPSTPITPEDILKVVGQEAQFSVYDLVDAILSGVVSRTTQLFVSLKDQGVDASLVLWAITREIRAMLEVSCSMKTGEAPSMVFKKARVWKHREALVTRFIERFSEKKCHEALLKAQRIDECLKGRTPGNIWNDLLSLCLFLTTSISLYPAISEI